MKTIIDFLSFTWTPAELAHVLELAKAGATVKAVRHFDFVESGQRVDNFALDTGKIDYAAEVRRLLKNTDFVIGGDARRFHEVKSDLLDHFGMNTMDCLCRGEIDRFINRLNHGLGKFGNEWTFTLRAGGFSGYPQSASIMVNGQQAGLCAWGAKQHGCYVSFSGTGCVALDMPEVHKMLNDLPGAKITRADVAYDCFNGEFGINLARQMAKEGCFITRGRPCSYTYIESGHMAKVYDYQTQSGTSQSLKKRYGLVPESGRSFYVGSRDAGKMLRVYEKGKQLKSDQHPEWVRWELELRSKDRVIPFDILIDADKYFAGAYPALSRICEAEQCAIATHKRHYMTSVENAVKHGATQCGKLVNYMRQVLELSPEQVVKQLTSHLEPFEIPDRLNAPVTGDSDASEKVPLADLLALRQRSQRNAIYQRLVTA
ncbi:replication initiation factor domain-containing protein [Photobacterium sp. 2_MG-2023]|uniref:replication initiation factor domain-containing protein n=1 Tax=Photobacterium sp. 2_MG-2023 TaxID=3062663 RepID=UPI0026E16153|nr:replication initiation factor domain-containing protein [Photobacterium sp. 2_MG-2023]MDO6580575.1 replication initiation factor domain-containing protein [Photobacterium sp. 2_MG-2023]